MYEIQSDGRTVIKKETVTETRETRFTMAEKAKELENAKSVVAALEAEIASIRAEIGGDENA